MRHREWVREAIRKARRALRGPRTHNKRRFWVSQLESLAAEVAGAYAEQEGDGPNHGLSAGDVVRLRDIARWARRQDGAQPVAPYGCDVGSEDSPRAWDVMLAEFLENRRAE